MSDQANDSIVISGCGWVTPLSCGGLTEVLHADAPPAPQPIDAQGYCPVPGDFVERCPSLQSEVKRDKGAWMTAMAMESACRQAAVDLGNMDATRVGSVLGCALSGLEGMIRFANDVRDKSPRFVSPIHFPQTVGNYAAGALARAYSLRGPNVTIANGAASGLDAITEGCRLLREGRADRILAGGFDTLTQELAIGFPQSDAVLTEGACVFVLERARDASRRGARPLASIGESCVRAADRRQDHDTTDDTIASTATTLAVGDIHIRHSVGHCFGALGACVVAAAVGFLQGQAVPVVTSTSPGAYSMQDITQLQSSGKNTPAVRCIAESESGLASELLIHSIT